VATSTTGPSAPSTATPRASARARIRERTLRTDNWRRPWLATLVGLSLFVIYTTWRAFENRYYYSTPYISPFYSPCVAANCVEGSRDLGTWVGDWWRLSPALLILVVPGGFRFTCYYYRKAYYRSFWQSPPGCAVAEPHKRYTGETRFPLILQNAHRYLFYAALVFNVILTYDAVLAFRNEDKEWGHMGLGTVILVANAVFLWLYTLSCHSCRHAVGGRINSFSRHPLRYKLWTQVSKLNARHMQFAWISLFGVALADFYVRQVASGAISDFRFF
jgi:hypothetical protein